jgi:hypothetical protein
MRGKRLTHRQIGGLLGRNAVTGASPIDSASVRIITRSPATHHKSTDGMNLKEYLLKKGKAPRGKTKEWLHFCTLEVTTGSLWAGDPYLANADDGCVVRVPRGRYAVEGIGLAWGRYRVVSRLRVRLESAKNPKLGKQRGVAGTDSAMIGVCDIKAFDRACGPDSGDEVHEAVAAQTGDGFGVITIKKRPGAVMPFVPTGSDGVGPVLALTSGGKCVGIELPFMDEEEEDGKRSAQETEAASLLGDDTDHFITRLTADGEEVSFWLGGELKAGVKCYLWSSHGPVDYRIRRDSGSVLRSWSSMKKKRGDDQYCALETLKPGRYEIDFRIGVHVFSALKLSLA